MSAEVDRLAPEYVAALEAYARQRDEAALSQAYELGRRAMVDGLGVLDMAVLHRAAVQALVVGESAADEQKRLAEAAADFFHELLSPFEMSLRGYRAANEALQRLNETLSQQKQAVEAVNHELESFSYSVSHDLRAPLRRIDGFSRILLEDYADKLDDEGKKHLESMCEATRYMGELIDVLLGLAHVTRAEIQRSEVDLSALAHHITETLRATARERSVEFVIEDGVRARGDARLLAVVLENLLGNAWKFTSKVAHARIEFGREEQRGGGGGTTAYFVRDNGAGFDMAYARKLFGAFQRLHAVSDFAGTGIGLATVQRVVHRHEGRVWGEGKVDAGATFYFTLGGPRS